MSYRVLYILKSCIPEPLHVVELEDQLRGLAFSAEELKCRYDRLRSVMEKKKLDAALITDPYDYYYFTGSPPLPLDFREMYNIALIPLDGDPVIIVQSSAEEPTKREQNERAWIKKVRVYKVIDVAGELKTETPVDILRACFNELGLAAGNVGVELGHELRLGISYLDFVRLTKEMPRLNFTDASEAIWQLRMIKSRNELKCLRVSGEITSKGLDAVSEQARVGMTEREVAQILHKAIVENGGRDVWTFMSSGPYNYGHNCRGPTERKLSEGNLLWIDCGCTFDGYFSDIARDFAIGRVETKQAKMHDITRTVTNRLVEKLRPGTKLSEIDEQCTRYLAGLGLTPTFNTMCGELGHGVGLCVTEVPSIPVDDITIRPGMYLALEPGFITDYGCFQTEQNVAITENGPEVYSVAQTDLKIVRSS